MYIPDLWIKCLKEQKDEDWDIGHIIFSLKNKRAKEKVVSYCESHDQAIVGDKTIAMWLFDKEIYTNMSVFKQETVLVFRGMALHKLIRFLSLLGGNAYLNFMGNEFGHPEWIDFPTSANNWSYKHCRRQWSLSEDKNLRYSFLLNWDIEMMKIEKKHDLLLNCDTTYIDCHYEDKVACFIGKSFYIVFNFHPNKVK